MGSQMNSTNALKQRFPDQFTRVFEYGLSIEPGWIGIIEDTCAQIDALLPENLKPRFSWLQVKEKMGGLRMYWSGGWIEPNMRGYIDGVGQMDWDPGLSDDAKSRVIKAIMRETMLPEPVCDEIRKITDAAEANASKTCQLCGLPGAHHVIDGWHWTVCDQHATKERIIAARMQQEEEYRDLCDG
jgi:hypothetical protein